MTPKDIETAVKYLLEKLSPDEQAELEDLLDDGVPPTLTEDATKIGRIGFDALPERMKRAYVARSQSRVIPATDVEQKKTLDEMFPNMNRLKGR